MSNLINEELDKMKYLLGYQKGKVVSEQVQQAAPAAPTAPDVIKQIQNTLNTKYGAKLTVDGKWGNLTQTAFEAATGGVKPAAAPAAPATAPATAPAAATATPKHGERKVDDVGNTFVYDGYNKKWVSDGEYLKLYNYDGTKK